MASNNLHEIWSLAEPDCRNLITLARQEDLRGEGDVTTLALVSADREGAAHVTTREAGVACGMPIGPLIRDAFDAHFDWQPHVEDGQQLTPGDRLATLSGRASDLLTCERTLLNFLGRLCGIATATHAFVQRVAGTKARIYDTRKTTPGWRMLEKYAVACGGGINHRIGLFDAVLIKDNHLAHAAEAGISLPAAVSQARSAAAPGTIIQIEVDTLDQLSQTLPAAPDIVLLDNMTNAELREAVARRDATAPVVELEASGGVIIDTVGQIAKTGVDRISVGALTHSAKSLDIGLDWRGISLPEVASSTKS